MSWFSGSNPLDELVEKATDDSLPSDMEDLTLNLEICDRIRSKAVTAKDAMRSLKKRLGNKNPNVQLLALNLCDLCIKNGGSHFLIEIASREFVDNLLSLLRAPTGINHDVRQRLLELIQGWALAFESRPELGYMMTVYHNLRSEGLQFPPEERVAAAFVDTAAPPDWADSDVCLRCRTAFTFRNRKHHCRNCGNVFCGQCSTQSMTLPQLGINEPVRVCDDCHAKRGQNASATTVPQRRSKAVPDYQAQTPKRHVSRAGDTEDLDLKRALELSLAESGSAKPPATQTLPAAAGARAAEIEDEDEDMKAAIAASLKDSSANKATGSYAYPVLDTREGRRKEVLSSPLPSSQQKVIQPSVINLQDIQPVDQENIKLFANLVDRLKVDTPGAILRDPQIQELYDGISALRPKVARSLAETVGKYESLVETHSKLATVVKYYDRILESRLTATYSQSQQYGSQYEDPSRTSRNYDDAEAHSYYGQTPQYHHSEINGHSGYDYRNSGSQNYQAGDQGYSSHAPSYPDTLPANSVYSAAKKDARQVQEPEQPKEEVSLIDL
ncbi:Vacuolar protein sorting-associated protein 27 [Taphrina deformans PYCC 5710]|uniref:Vacuolar protein sorting-associated protein 27 n=1 Tax=Taphrina deformans (strain PYCC 5710 / ATCC 11124 / CBS 356.35 / IMI 108563 / JCM 9778 / NBRC 8474) TaxID=1097556 RepID=R4XHH8_TAPDE|nr:Vacuolar protein sorting-associated protein 27 [Taphrina deformans PYCC 5710]|eukprot:CCG82872.1 Vacuolar protein sorting-associated protein 27 [Taphrina deformans PYCC 5710]